MGFWSALGGELKDLGNATLEGVKKNLSNGGGGGGADGTKQPAAVGAQPVASAPQPVSAGVGATGASYGPMGAAPPQQSYMRPFNAQQQFQPEALPFRPYGQ